MSDRQNTIQIDRWHPCPSGARIGILDATLPSGMTLYGIVVFCKDGRRWTKLPSQRWQRRDGQMAEAPVVEIRERDRKDAFDRQLLDELDRYVTGGCR